MIRAVIIHNSVHDPSIDPALHLQLGRAAAVRPAMNTMGLVRNVVDILKIDLELDVLKVAAQQSQAAVK